MGCGASKLSNNPAVVYPEAQGNNPTESKESNTAGVEVSMGIKDDVRQTENMDIKQSPSKSVAGECGGCNVAVIEITGRESATLAKPVIPSISTNKPQSEKQSDKENPSEKQPTLRPTKKPVAFEISLDDDTASLKSETNKSSSFTLPRIDNQPSSAKSSLPKLSLTNADIQAKLANTEERWKNIDVEKKKRRGKAKPELSHSTNNSSRSVEDRILLKQRLLEKEIQAAQNRQREIEKLQAKLARQDERARKVLERKKKLGKLSNEDLNISWGGENGGLAIAAEASLLFRDSSLILTKKGSLNDIDSGLGSSQGSRSGSGRSLGTNIDVGEDSEAEAQAKKLQLTLQS